MSQLTRRNLIASVFAMIPMALVSKSAQALTAEPFKKAGLNTAEGAGGLWHILKQSTDGTDPSTMITTELPRITPEIRALAGREIELQGYLQPVVQAFGKSEYILSQMPFHCTGCYMPGRGALALVQSRVPAHMPAEGGMVWVKGKLVLNETVPDDFYFILENASFRTSA